jgi:hypothetical protein
MLNEDERVVASADLSKLSMSLVWTFAMETASLPGWLFLLPDHACQPCYPENLGTGLKDMNGETISDALWQIFIDAGGFPHPKFMGG